MINNMSSSDKESVESRDTIDIINKARDGESESFFELKRKYTPLLESLVIKHTLPEMLREEADDMRQEALISFCNAIYNFDCENEGVEFGLYAKICIENRLISYKRSYLRRHKSESLPLESVEGVVDYSSPDPLQMIVAKEKTEELVRSIQNNLSDYENRVWWMYVSGMSPSEIAKEIGEVDAKSVSNAVYRIRKKLRNVIGSQQ